MPPRGHKSRQKEKVMTKTNLPVMALSWWVATTTLGRGPVRSPCKQVSKWFRWSIYPIGCAAKVNMSMIWRWYSKGTNSKQEKVGPIRIFMMWIWHKHLNKNYNAPVDPSAQECCRSWKNIVNVIRIKIYCGHQILTIQHHSIESILFLTNLAERR